MEFETGDGRDYILETAKGNRALVHLNCDPSDLSWKTFEELCNMIDVMVEAARDGMLNAPPEETRRG